jgi:hypothetical protein
MTESILTFDKLPLKLQEALQNALSKSKLSCNVIKGGIKRGGVKKGGGIQDIPNKLNKIKEILINGFVCKSQITQTDVENFDNVLFEEPTLITTFKDLPPDILLKIVALSLDKLGDIRLLNKEIKAIANSELFSNTPISSIQQLLYSLPFEYYDILRDVFFNLLYIEYKRTCNISRADLALREFEPDNMFEIFLDNKIITIAANNLICSIEISMNIPSEEFKTVLNYISKEILKLNLVNRQIILNREIMYEFSENSIKLIISNIFDPNKLKNIMDKSDKNMDKYLIKTTNLMFLTIFPEDIAKFKANEVKYESTASDERNTLNLYNKLCEVRSINLMKKLQKKLKPIINTNSPFKSKILELAQSQRSVQPTVQLPTKTQVQLPQPTGIYVENYVMTKDEITIIKESIKINIDKIFTNITFIHKFLNIILMHFLSECETYKLNRGNSNRNTYFDLLCSWIKSGCLQPNFENLDLKTYFELLFADNTEILLYAKMPTLPDGQISSKFNISILKKTSLTNIESITKEKTELLIENTPEGREHVDLLINFSPELYNWTKNPILPTDQTKILKDYFFIPGYIELSQQVAGSVKLPRGSIKKYTKTTQKIKYHNRTYVVYKGKRGGKYIKTKNQFKNLTSIKTSKRFIKS